MRRVVTLSLLYTLAVTSSALARPKSKRSAQGSDFVALDTASLIFRLWSATGAYQIVDKQGGAVWESNPYRQHFGEAFVQVNGRLQPAELGRCEVTRSRGALEATFRPFSRRPRLWVRVRIKLIDDGAGVEFSYSASEQGAVESVRLLDDALWTSNEEKGYAVVPVRMGLVIPADSGLEFLHDFDTSEYEGCHMEMMGIVKSGATVLLTWDDPYVNAEVRSQILRRKSLPPRQVLSTSLVLFRSAHAVQLRFPGRGDYLTIGRAYRQIARQRGLLVPWAEKLKTNPERAKLFGAINFKLWSALERQMDEGSTVEESVKVNWTFEEAAQVAEHLKNDLKLDKVLFTVGGWIRRGYDNQHPDIMPPAPECGGGVALAQCARRVRRLGYLFCLHDNYQDIYRDSPDWDEDLIVKDARGRLVKGGKWAGGQAYQICSQQGNRLARRSQNLPAVKKLTDANAYFIDTTYASGLRECFDPRHPSTRPDDMKWKLELSDYARSLFGVFGSEDGREWALPHADFFEGLVGVNGTWFHDRKLMSELGGISVPLFEIVYRDSIALYGKYGFDVMNSADYVLYHISIGRTLNYHAVPPHLYWRQPSPTARAETNPGDPALFTRGDQGWSAGLHPLDRFVKNTYEVLSPLNELTAGMELAVHEFLTSDRKVQRTVFGAGPEQVQVIVNTGAGYFRYQTGGWGVVLLPKGGFFVESPGFVALHALTWGRIAYAPRSAPLFTLRSLDGQPLSRSKRIRVYHGFGDTRLWLGGSMREVAREAVLSASPAVN
jgi:hypothetical protein